MPATVPSLARFLAGALALLLQALPCANAQSWRPIGDSESGSKVFVDVAGRETDGRYVRVRSREILPSPNASTLGYTYDEVVTTLLVQCETRKLAAQEIAYLFAGAQVRRWPSDPASVARANFVDAASATSQAIVQAACEPGARVTPSLANPVPTPSARHVSSGSGFVVERVGAAITNQHVVSGCQDVSVLLADGSTYPARVAAEDRRNDLALLKFSRTFERTAVFRSTPAAPGEPIIAVGFPLRGLLATQANISAGIVSATAGLANDTSRLQISAPVQPGNSGGPLLDASGLVVGVVVEKLDAIRVARLTGDIPQNINFALKVDVVNAFLATHGIRAASLASSKKLEPAEVAEIGRAVTVLVECAR